MKKDTTSYGAVRPAWDKADCSVRALATATGVGYEIASVTFSAQGRTLKKGTSIALSERLYEGVLGMKRVTMAEGLRLEAFLQVAQKGRFIVHKLGHAFAVVDGVVHDWEGTSRENTTLLQVWKVTDVALAKMERMREIVEGL